MKNLRLEPTKRSKNGETSPIQRLHSLRETPFLRPLIKGITAALEAVDPRHSIIENCSRQGDTLRLGGAEYFLGSYRRIRVVGAGKAAGLMAEALYEVLDDKIEDGLVVVKKGEPESFDTGVIDVVGARHPVPDENSCLAGERIWRLAQELSEDDLLIVLISGGASALLTLPVSNVSLPDLQKTTDVLIKSGADIEEINGVRKHLSVVKGGGLSRAAWPASVVSMILSDVVGDPVDAIGSGPTAPDRTTFEDAWNVLAKYDLLHRVPDAVVSHLEQGRNGDVDETAKPGDPCFNVTKNTIVGSNQRAADAAEQGIAQEGFNTRLLTSIQTGEAREVGSQLAKLARRIREGRGPVVPPACILVGGETTVTVTGDGLGGRNQELALAAAMELQGCAQSAVVSFATDGQDGPTDAAGAIATGDTVQRAMSRQLDPSAFLSNNDAYHFFKPLDDLIFTGPTGTNVADLMFVFVL